MARPARAPARLGQTTIPRPPVGRAVTLIQVVGRVAVRVAVVGRAAVVSRVAVRVAVVGRAVTRVAPVGQETARVPAVGQETVRVQMTPHPRFRQTTFLIQTSPPHPTRTRPAMTS